MDTKTAAPSYQNICIAATIEMFMAESNFHGEYFFKTSNKTDNEALVTQFVAVL